jgi:hypothetical protein
VRINATIFEFWRAEDLTVERRGILLSSVIAVRNQHFDVFPDPRR